MLKSKLQSVLRRALARLSSVWDRLIRRTPRSGIDRGHGLHDPHDASTHAGWYPITPEAIQLALCVESCKQINEMRPMLLRGKPSPRSLTLLATPVLNLVKHVLKLQKDLGQADRSGWPEPARKNFETLPEALEKFRLGALRQIRNKRAAHTDAKAFQSGGAPASTPENVLRPLGQAAVLLLLCLNHTRSFGYARQPEPDSKDEIEFFFQYPIASRFRLNNQGHPVEILGAHLERDPRHELGEVVCATIDLYNAIVSKVPGLSQIRIGRQ